MSRPSKNKKSRSSCRCGQDVTHLDMKKDEKKPELIEKNGHTYGTFAAKAGCIKCVETLIQRHIDPNLSQNHNGSNVLISKYISNTLFVSFLEAPCCIMLLLMDVQMLSIYFVKMGQKSIKLTNGESSNFSKLT